MPLSDISQEEHALPLIINGTSSTVGYKAEAFIYCRVDKHDQANLHKYEIHWLDQNNIKVPKWSSDKYVFIIGDGRHIPESYLVFRDFNERYAGGIYTCELRNKKEGYFIASSKITISKAV
ncbi:unnamed protein product [Meganyctiphanes norvegica]|uniref:Ig-like domain-containing protein n=1 Tax=Meganyctiphanes norvegica TaxID=48144 RepID=A0AAV2SCJ8_MEGNR